VSDKGHADVWDVHGHVVTLNARIVHDNWKPISLWLIKEAQVLQREVAWTRVRKTGLVRWLRVRPPLMPIVVFLYCLFGKGLIFNGRGGIFYALQRMVAEAVLSLMLLEEKLRDQPLAPLVQLPRIIEVLTECSHFCSAATSAERAAPS
jgi:hypothetical protein